MTGGGLVAPTRFQEPLTYMYNYNVSLVIKMSLSKATPELIFEAGPVYI